MLAGSLWRPGRSALVFTCMRPGGEHVDGAGEGETAPRPMLSTAVRATPSPGHCGNSGVSAEAGDVPHVCAQALHIH